MGIIKSYLKTTAPYQILVMGYMLVTITSAFLLSLPISSAKGQWQNFTDALFVAVSGISTSGLTVVDIGSYYSLFGQIVLLCTFQIGGIGYMTFILFFSYAFGLRTSLITQIVARESLASPDLRALGKFFFATLNFTILFEFLGAFALTLLWMEEFPLLRSIYLAVFHSVSAFCTAGFGLFSDSLMRWRDNFPVNMTINVVSLAGGIGFFVLYDIYLYLKKIVKPDVNRRISVHSRLVLIFTVSIILFGTYVIFMTEQWDTSINIPQRVMISAFQSISASTTDGFNTVDINKMGPASQTMLMALMFVGAGPGSTGGGIKTSTLFVILLFLWALFKGRDDNVNIFRREIPSSTIRKAFGVFGWFVLIILIDMLIMVATEHATYSQILFEIISALGNTGLSTGITANLGLMGKIMLIITMFIGRVGQLTIGFSLVGSQKPLGFRYMKEDIFVG